MTKNRLYEGMFLVDSALAGSNWDGVNQTIKTILDRVGAEVVSMRKWDDRKLAYEIKGTSRGTYILCYFSADGDKIKDIEKAVQLSEQIIRVLILNAEQMTTDDMNKETPAAEAEREKSPDKETQDTGEKARATKEEQPDDSSPEAKDEDKDSEPTDESEPDEQDVVEKEDDAETRE